jgi:hypothetical protein
MKKIKYFIPLIALSFAIFYSCNNDDNSDSNFIPARDRGEESIVAQGLIEEYLETHFYNYEDFENPPLDFNFQIVFDTIAEDNSDKIPLINQVLSKFVDDVVDTDVTYKFYYLNVIQGEGDPTNIADITSLTYEGRYLDNNELFDSSVTPVRFDITQVVRGFHAGLIEFNGATGFEEIGNGLIAFENYGVGAVFIPSGLGYYVTPPPSSAIPLYSELIFTFQLYTIERGDQDNDGILSYLEDLNNNGYVGDDDTDENGNADYIDADDDGDGRLTKDEIELNDYTINPGDADPEFVEDEVEMYREIDEETGEIKIYTVILTDSNNDGIPDYLDDEI